LFFSATSAVAEVSNLVVLVAMDCRITLSGIPASSSLMMSAFVSVAADAMALTPSRLAANHFFIALLPRWLKREDSRNLNWRYVSR
jgi:hypothetical protein